MTVTIEQFEALKAHVEGLERGLLALAEALGPLVQKPPQKSHVERLLE